MTMIAAGIILMMMMVMVLILWESITDNIIFTNNLFNVYSKELIIIIKLPVPGRPTIWMIVGQGPTALAVGAGGGCLDIFTLLFLFSPLSPSLWETARYRLKYCLKGSLNPKQPTKIIIIILFPNTINCHVIVRILTTHFSGKVINSCFSGQQQLFR